MTAISTRDTGKLAILPQQDAEFLERMIGGYVTRREALRHQASSINRDVAVINDLVRFTKKAPWHWTESDFERWGSDLGRNRKLAVSSQRHYQGAIRGFLKYVTENVAFRNEVRRLYGVEIVQICTSENCIPHIEDRELSRDRPAFTHEQIDTLFCAIDRAINETALYRCKDVVPLMRDKAMLGTAYFGALRDSEVIGLNVTSFEINPAVPEFGDYGFINVWGKGSNGSGPRHGVVQVTYQGYPPLMEWYVREVRPLLMRNADPNEQALFLSERGQRIRRSTLIARFHHCVALAGLDGRGLVPHSLRHSGGSHEAMRFGGEMARRKLRHRHLSTTQGYMHIPDNYIQDEVNRVIRESLDLATGKKT
jgi:site-specific recombinase XerD